MSQKVVEVCTLFKKQSFCIVSFMTQLKGKGGKRKPVPLPSNYQLPANYSRDVMEGLENRQLTYLQQKHLFSQIAGSIFVHTPKITPEERTHVANLILKQWPFLEGKGKLVSLVYACQLCINFFVF